MQFSFVFPFKNYLTVTDWIKIRPLQQFRLSSKKRHFWVAFTLFDLHFTCLGNIALVVVHRVSLSIRQITRFISDSCNCIQMEQIVSQLQKEAEKLHLKEEELKLKENKLNMVVDQQLKVTMRIKLNIGGIKFTTTLSILVADPDSILAKRRGEIFPIITLVKVLERTIGFLP